MVSNEKLFKKLRGAYSSGPIQAWAIDVFSEVFRVSREMAIEILSDRIKVEFDVTGRMFYQS